MTTGDVTEGGAYIGESLTRRHHTTKQRSRRRLPHAAYDTTTGNDFSQLLTLW